MKTEFSEFNLLRGFYNAQEQRPDSYEPIELRTVAPFLRSLLVKDGTVTSALSAFYLQEIVTTQIVQTAASLEHEDIWLALDPGAEVLQRQVMLTGADDGRLFLFAESCLAVQRLPENMRRALDDENSNLGRLLRAGRLETLREGLWYGRERLSRLPTPISDRCDGDFLSRKYRILSQRAPLMTVVERFPITNFGRADNSSL